MTFNVAVIGLGVGEQHARAFASHPNCRVTWLIDHDKDRASNLASKLETTRVAECLDQALEDESIDILSIASFDDDHYEQVLKGLGKGKHIFVEKPLCRTLEETETLQAAWTTAEKLHLRSNLVLRGAPFYQWLRLAIQAGELGEIYAFDGDYLYGRLEKITDGWRKNVNNYSVMEGGGIHIVDLMLWLLDDVPKRVSTIGTKIQTRNTEFSYDDFMASTFEFASGVVGRVTANFGCIHPHHHILRVFGTKATVIYDDQGPRMFRNRKDGAHAIPLMYSPLPGNKGVLIPSFVEAIRNGADPKPTALREFQLITVCAGADQAHHLGAPQTITRMT